MCSGSLYHFIDLPQAAVIAIANIYYGVLYIWVLGVWPWASYTAVLAVIVGVSVTKDTRDWLRWVGWRRGTPGCNPQLRWMRRCCPPL